MAHLSPAFVQFFRDLSENNNSEWFHANKKTYEAEVKKPFEALVADVISGVGKIDPEVTIAPKDAIKRINRDIRFSNDKRPYNCEMAAIVSRAGKKDKSCPGMYFSCSHEGVRAFGGVYMADPEQLANIRRAIGNSPEDFKSLYCAPEFRELYGELQGEKNKVLPPEFKQAAEREPLIYNKQFYFGANLPVDVVTSDKLLDTLVNCYRVATPLNSFLQRAMVG